MVNNGCLTLIQGAIPEIHMYGFNTRSPPSQKVNHAFYYLHGGSKTQDASYKACLNKVSSQHLHCFISCSLASPILILSNDDKFQMMSNANCHCVKDPFKLNTIEYLQQNTPDIPYKWAKATPESEDSPPLSPKSSS